MTKAYVIEEGTTNLVRNPSGTSTNSWSSAVANQSLTAVNDDPHEGDTCLMLESRGTGAGFLVGAMGEDIVDGTTYTASVYVKVPDQRWVNIAIHCSYTDDGSYYANSQSFSLEPNVWTRLQVTGVVPDPRGTITSARARVTTPNDTGETLVWYADSAQFEAKPYATPFTHGDMGEGYSWEGTPHSSSSIREPSSISMPSPEPKSLYIRYSEDGENWNNEYVSFEDKPEDIEPTLLLSPDGSYDRDGEVTPTITGGVLEVDGEYGKAWQLAEATTNIVPNPTFTPAESYSSDFNGWSLQSLEAESLPPTEESLAAGVPSKIAKLTRLEGASSILWSTTTKGSLWWLPVTEGLSYTGSMYVKGVAGKTTEMVLYFRGDAGYISAEKQTVPITSDKWQRYSATAVAPPDATHVAFMIYLLGNVNANLEVGDVAYISSPQLEQNTYATPYADGSLGAGYEWTGITNASASTRSNSVVSLTTAQSAVVPWMKGSALLRTTLMNSAGTFMTLGYPFSPTNHISVRSYDGGAYQLYLGTNSVLLYRPTTGIPLDTGPKTLYAEWDGEDIAISLDGGPKMHSTRPVPVDQPWETWGLRISGHRWHNAESALFFDTPLTDAEVQRIATMNKAWTWEEATGFKVTADLGQHAKIRYVDNKLKILTDKKLYIGTVIGFSRPLSQKEVAILDSTPLAYINGKTLLNLPDTTIGVSQLL